MLPPSADRAAALRHQHEQQRERTGHAQPRRVERRRRVAAARQGHARDAAERRGEDAAARQREQHDRGDREHRRRHARLERQQRQRHQRAEHETEQREEGAAARDPRVIEAGAVGTGQEQQGRAELAHVLAQARRRPTFRPVSGI